MLKLHGAHIISHSGYRFGCNNIKIMSELYPLKFDPILKEKIWGGPSLEKNYGKNRGTLKNIGESWEISAVSGDLSVVSNGFLAGNNIEEIIEVYMGDLTGERIYEKFGNEFPLLIKLIEAREDLSVQVHPGNDLARKRHRAYGKTEMWYILQSNEDARIYTGFSREVSREEYLSALDKNNIAALLKKETALPGDVFFTPAGTIHAIGSGIVLAEIQQTSDITYRISDWGRVDNNGKSRELHNDLAIDAIDFKSSGNYRIRKDHEKNIPLKLVGCEFFNASLIDFNEAMVRDYNIFDSFVIYLCIEGAFIIRWEGRSERVTKGETVLLPAVLTDVTLIPQPEAGILEIYIDNIDTDH